MDQMPAGNEGYNSNAANFFPDSQHLNAFDSLFPNGTDQTSYDAGWGVNASAYPQPAPSRAVAAHTQPWLSQQQHGGNIAAQLPVNDDPQRQPVYGRSPLHSPAPLNQHHEYPYGSQHPDYRFQGYDPAAVAPPSHSFNDTYAAFQARPASTTTVAPHALEHQLPRRQSGDDLNYSGSTYRPPGVVTPASTAPFDQNALSNAIPLGDQAGIFKIVDFDRLVRVTNSERMGNYVTIGRNALAWPMNRVALPSHTARKSTHELKRLAVAKDPSLLLRLTQRSVKKQKAAALVAARPSKMNGAVSTVGSPSVSRDESDGESSDADDSDNTSDSDVDDSPLPSKRPDAPKSAVEYDTIKALWRSKRKVVDANEVRKGLVDFWEVVKTIRDRWKADATAVTQAEEKGLKGELPLLRQRVKDQRDMIESAFKTALKYGNRTIVETLSENIPLIFVCYQFLLDRFKDGDVNGSLSRSVLELASIFQTMTDDKLEKTYLVKVLPRYIKNGDAKTQYYAKTITAKAASNTSEKAHGPRSQGAKLAGATKEEAAPSPPAKPEPVAGVKRAATTTVTGTAPKKIAVGANKPGVTAKATGAVQKSANSIDPTTAIKKFTNVTDATKASSGAIGAPTAKAKPASVRTLPTSLFAGLQSAAKRPGTSSKPTPSSTVVKETEQKPAAPAKPAFSFAETMRNLAKPKEEKPAPKPEKELPPETAEQKTKRIKKEARGALRVHWKIGEELVEVREFSHDPDEELGHDSSQTRDVADLRGEGRMFKQQHNSMMDVDEEEDEVMAASNTAALDTAADGKMVEWREPGEIDFSVVDEEERKRNYHPRGGGELQPESAENALREEHEANTLMVFYSRPEDVPINPREPDEPHSGNAATQVTGFGEPPKEYADRARQTRAAQQHTHQHPAVPPRVSHAPIDFDFLRRALGGQQPNDTPSTGQPFRSDFPAPPSQALAASTTIPDLAKILAQLNSSGGSADRQQQQQQQQQQHAPVSAFAPQPQMAPSSQLWPGFSQQQQQQQQTPSLPNGQPDINAILAQLKNAEAGPAASQAPQQQGTYGAGSGAGANVNDSLAALMQQLGGGGPTENAERKRWRDQGGGEQEELRKDNPFYKTKVCKYYSIGKCMKGDECTYRHA